MERRAFITLLSCTPITGLVPCAPTQGFIRLYFEGELVAEQELQFQVNSTMKVSLTNAKFSIDRMELYNEFGTLVSVKRWQHINVLPHDTLNISWKVSIEVPEHLPHVSYERAQETLKWVTDNYGEKAWLQSAGIVKDSRSSHFVMVNVQDRFHATEARYSLLPYQHGIVCIVVHPLLEV